MRAGRFIRVGRNEDCPCGSRQKFKKCCMGAVEARRRRANRLALAIGLGFAGLAAFLYLQVGAAWGALLGFLDLLSVLGYFIAMTPHPDLPSSSSGLVDEAFYDGDPDPD